MAIFPCTMLGMLEPAEAFRLILWALALGVILPVMIQLFLTLRQARQTMARLTDQIEPSLAVFSELAQKPREMRAAGSSVASIVATVIPAVVAAYRAFREHQAEEEQAAQSLERNRNDDHVPTGH
jgi:ABC-type spermidine/putrescine transport system permease subunit II